MQSFNDYYSIDNGFIISKILGDRSFVIGSSVWNQIERRLYNNYGSGASVIFYDMGKGYGISLVDRLRKVAKGETTEQNIMDLMIQHAAVAGWGKAVVSREGLEIRVRVTDCVFCSHYVENERPEGRCYFLKGILSGAAETIFRRQFRITENHCSKKFCEFVLIPE